MLHESRQRSILCVAAGATVEFIWTEGKWYFVGRIDRQRYAIGSFQGSFLSPEQGLSRNQRRGIPSGSRLHFFKIHPLMVLKIRPHSGFCALSPVRRISERQKKQQRSRVPKIESGYGVGDGFFEKSVPEGYHLCRLGKEESQQKKGVWVGIDARVMCVKIWRMKFWTHRCCKDFQLGLPSTCWTGHVASRQRTDLPFVLFSGGYTARQGTVEEFRFVWQDGDTGLFLLKPVTGESSNYGFIVPLFLNHDYWLYGLFLL